MRRPRRARYFVTETMLILVGVLAALFLEGAWERRRAAAEGEAALRRVLDEVSANEAEVDDLERVVSERLERLRDAAAGAGAATALADLSGRFGGFRTPNFGEAAWARFHGSDLAASVDPDLLREAFLLYEWNAELEGLNASVRELVFSELYHDPDKTRTAIAVAIGIMEQQLSWARALGEHYADFIGAYGRASPTP